MATPTGSAKRRRLGRTSGFMATELLKPNPVSVHVCGNVLKFTLVDFFHNATLPSV